MVLAHVARADLQQPIVESVREKDIQVFTMTCPIAEYSSLLQVAPIISSVQERGDAAVREYTSKFDGVNLDAICVPIDDIPTPSLPPNIEASFDIAYENIYNFHKAQDSGEISVDTMPGVICRQVRILALRLTLSTGQHHGEESRQLLPPMPLLQCTGA
jgi:histidinol dehydrogenase